MVRYRSTNNSLNLSPVHTNPFSNVNGAVLLQIRLSSTLQRRKWWPKTESFENPLHSGAIWKRCFLKTLSSSVDGENHAIWKRWLHPNRHDRASAHSTVSIQNGEQSVPCGFSLDDRCCVDGRKRYENDNWGPKSFSGIQFAVKLTVYVAPLRVQIQLVIMVHSNVFVVFFCAMWQMFLFWLILCW